MAQVLLELVGSQHRYTGSHYSLPLQTSDLYILELENPVELLKVFWMTHSIQRLFALITVALPKFFGFSNSRLDKALLNIQEMKIS